MASNNSCFFAVLSALLFIGCASKTNNEMIVGKWESVMDKEKLEAQMESLRRMNMKIVMTFDSKGFLKSEMVRMGEVTATYNATYEFDIDQKRLIVYREGKKEQKNVAEILSITDSKLTLVDESGSGDTLVLRRISN